MTFDEKVTACEVILRSKSGEIYDTAIEQIDAECSVLGAVAFGDCDPDAGRIELLVRDDREVSITLQSSGDLVSTP